jgi:hypothetical protein
MRGNCMNEVEEQTIIKPSEAGLVAEEDGEFRLIMPEYEDDEDVPQGALLIAAISIKLNDPEWIDLTMAALD